ncbi:MAG: beta-ribofuranosylaminobenzene 5'-phosphate synthase [Methanothrix sp.]|uniref:beta-ribofuranosylaminobenzene 5'-phosphate synthase n=1 Tax=Methanothrix sp. TaxID=90426 RepID=UPI00247D7AA1|nr:beta-ribofuranosylaminobenzene 5'-phosphate synthase [Methanothrix sp.]
MTFAFPVAQEIAKLERIVGRLSPVQKMLLGTDGSVTSLLEVITGEPVGIETLEQRVVPATEDVARELNIEAGEDVNYRVVRLKNVRTGETLIHAVSYTPLKRLEPGFRNDLMRADIPIGQILHKHRIESRRDITKTECEQADERMSQLFNIFPRELMLSRRYKIIRKGEPLIAIRETFPYNMFQDTRRVIVETPARIHMTLTDLCGEAGRVDGGVGIALDKPNIVVEGEIDRELSVEGTQAERALDAAKKVAERFGLGGARISVRSCYRTHVGLGSGTQLAVAVGKTLCELYGHKANIREIASAVSRGGTSGIGVAAFEMGGFIVDGGHTFGPGREKSDFRPSSASAGVRPPPVIARHDFPESWRIVLAVPNIEKGAYGQREVDIFREYCPVPLSEVQELCYQIMVRMMPSVIEEDLDTFGMAVNRIQQLGFKRVEVELQHPMVKMLMQEMVSAGAACAGLSSFGPTVYAITDTNTREIESAARDVMGDVGGEVIITRSRNQGARIRTA